jgi:hypothetical protein
MSSTAEAIASSIVTALRRAGVQGSLGRMRQTHPELTRDIDDLLWTLRHGVEQAATALANRQADSAESAGSTRLRTVA